MYRPADGRDSVTRDALTPEEAPARGLEKAQTQEKANVTWGLDVLGGCSRKWKPVVVVFMFSREEQGEKC